MRRIWVVHCLEGCGIITALRLGRRCVIGSGATTPFIAQRSQPTRMAVEPFLVIAPQPINLPLIVSVQSRKVDSLSQLSFYPSLRNGMNVREDRSTFLCPASNRD